VRCHEIDRRPDRAERDDAGRVHPLLAAVVVALDVVHVDGLGHARPLIEIAHVVRQVRVVDDPLQVALEVVVVDRVETALGKSDGSLPSEQNASNVFVIAVTAVHRPWVQWCACNGGLAAVRTGRNVMITHETIRTLTDAELDETSGGGKICHYTTGTSTITAQCGPKHTNPLINAFLEGFEQGKQKAT
jgi:hypothetical protein